MMRSRAAVWLCAVCTCSMVGLGDRALRASNPAPATVSISRVTALNESVWPGDFNGDGITDLAASDTALGGNAPYVLVALGKGDGTFGTPLKSAFAGRVLAVGDFNHDGKLDVVAAANATVHAPVVLAGHGDGTLGTADHVDDAMDANFALAADIDGDGKLDLIVGGSKNNGDVIEVFPGNGDFTFGAPVVLATGAFPIDGIVKDLNGDGKKDVVVANHYGQSLSIFLNQGGLTFTAADVALDREANDVTAADLNGDGKVDLAVATAGGGDGDTYFTEGYAYVLLGNGDGTFGQPSKYQVPPGTWQIVVGDFTRDGKIDIATANRSSVYVDDCSIPFKTWDTVSVLPGNGDGTFAAPSSFSLGDQAKLYDTRFKNTVLSLNTSDVNGDGATDLVASWGAILKNNPLDANWPPSVTASSTQPSSNDEQITLTAPASDSDQDMLTYSWIDSGGTPIPPVPEHCFTPINFGVHTFTVTVDDQHGHTASSSVTVDFGNPNGTAPAMSVTAPTTGEVVAAGAPYTVKWTASAGSGTIDHFDVEFSSDDGAHYSFVTGCTNLSPTTTSCTWNDPDPPTDVARIFVLATVTNGPDGSATTGPFTISASGGGGALPSGWSQGDIGAVTAAGSGSFDSSTGEWTVTGDGADIWGTADAFHYVYRQMPQSFDMQARVDSVQDVSAWTKAGIMVRTSLDPGASQASVFVTPGHGIVFQARTSQGATSVSTSGPALVAPAWVRLAGFNGGIWAYYRKTITDPWTFIGRQVLSNYSSSTPYVGLAVTSHSSGALATATFSQLTFNTIPPWSAASIGVNGTDANASWDGTLFNIFTQSSDIWGTADAFMYIFTSDTGDTTITARVTRLDDTSGWAKAGVMFRESTAAGSPHVFLMVTPGKGVNLQYRATAGGISASAGSIAGVAPGWLRLQRAGNTFTGSWSTDGVTFHTVGSVTVSMPSGVLVGMADTSHNTSTGGEGRFDDVDIRQP